MFKDRSKIFFITIVVECFIAVMFLIFSSMNMILSDNVNEYLTVGTLYSYTGIQTTGILLIISAILNLVGFIYKKKDLLTMGTILVIVSLVSDFFGTALLICYQQACDEALLFGSILYLLLILVMIVILLISFDDQLKLLKGNKEKKSK